MEKLVDQSNRKSGSETKMATSNGLSVAVFLREVLMR